MNPTIERPPTGRQTQTRALERAATVVDHARRLELSFSSEAPVARGFGREVLSHAPGAADLSRLNDGAPVLMNHDIRQIVGVVERAWIDDATRKGRAVVRFAKSTAGDDAMSLVEDKVLRNVSFAYSVDSYRAADDNDGDEPTYVAQRWQALEISLVAVPADQSVGVGRSLNTFSKGNQMEHIEGNERGSRAERAAARDSESRVEAEAQRVAEIRGIGSKFNLRAAEVDQFVREGYSVSEVRGIVLERKAANPQQPVAGFDAGGIGLSDKETREFSISKAIKAQLTGDWSAAGLERAASQAEYKRLGREQTDPRAILIPSDIKWSTRAPYNTGAVGTGGALVATELLAANFIDVLRNASVTAQLGAKYLTGLVGKVDIPRQATQTQTYWVAESAAITEAEATTDKVSLSPKTLGALSTISRLMLLQSTPAIEQMVRQDLVRVIALELDRVSMLGSGSSGQPLGIVNQSGVGSVAMGANGGAVTFDALLSLQNALKVANAPSDALGFAINAKTRSALASLKATTGQYLWTPGGGGAYASVADTILGNQYVVSNQLPSNLTKGTSSGICSQAIYGNWQELLVGMWGSLELLVNPYDSTGFTTGDVKIRAMQTIDVAVKHAASFAVVSDLTTSPF